MAMPSGDVLGRPAAIMALAVPWPTWSRGDRSSGREVSAGFVPVPAASMLT